MHRSVRVVIAGGVALTAGVLAFILTHTSHDSNEGRVRIGVKTAAAQCHGEAYDECLPELDLVDTQGNRWSAESLAGKVVMVNFWATWCAPCIAELPVLAQSYDAYADDGFVILGILTDAVSDDELEQFAAQHQLHYPIIRADSTVIGLFGNPSGLPTTFVYDRAGQLQMRHLGALDQAQLDAKLEPLLE